MSAILYCNFLLSYMVDNTVLSHKPTYNMTALRINMALFSSFGWENYLHFGCMCACRKLKGTSPSLHQQQNVLLPLPPFPVAIALPPQALSVVPGEHHHLEQPSKRPTYFFLFRLNLSLFIQTILTDFYVFSLCIFLPGKALVIGHPPPVGESRGLHPLSPLLNLHLSRNLPLLQLALLSWGRESPNLKMDLQWLLQHHNIKIPAQPAQSPAPSPKMVRTTWAHSITLLSITANQTKSEVHQVSTN